MTLAGIVALILIMAGVCLLIRKDLVAGAIALVVGLVIGGYGIHLH